MKPADRQTTAGGGCPSGWNEADRLRALTRYRILDTDREAAFDDIAELAADILDAPIAVVNFIAADRQWFKAEKGIGQRSLPLEVSICRHAILQPGVFVVPDLTQDARFEGNPLVEAAEGLRFYAGALLETPDGLPLGTVCVLDTEPRPDGISERQQRALAALAAQTMAQLELKLSTAIAREESERLAAMFAQASVGMSEIRLDGRFVKVNERLCEMLGRPREEVLTLGIRDTTHPDDLAENMPLFERLAETGESFSLDKRYLRPDGSVVWANSAVTRLLDAHGQPRAALAVTTDISARKEEARHRAFLLDLGDRTRNIADPKDVVLAATEALGRELGASRVAYVEIDEARGLAFGASSWTNGMLSALPDEMHLRDFEGAILGCLREGRTFRVADALADPRASGSSHVLEPIGARAIVSVPLLKHGRLLGNFNVHDSAPRAWTDAEVALIEAVAERTWEAIERARAQSALQESEARYRQIVEGAEDYAIVRLDDHGIVTSWNTGAERISGFPEAEVIGQPAGIIFTEEDRAAGEPERELRRARHAGRALNERWHVRRDGSRFWASGLMMRLDAEGGGFLNMFRDRTAEHEAEAALAAEVEALGRLQEVSTRLVGDEAPQVLFDAILSAAAELMGSECASLQILDAAGDLQLIAHRGYDPRSVAYWQTVTASSGSTCGIALTTGERVVVTDVEEAGLAPDSGDLKSYRWTGMRAIQTTPLLSRSGQPIGMISTHWKRPHTPSERDLKLFDVLARQAADAIERTTAQAKLRESEARQAFLLALSDSLRSLRTPAEIASTVAERLGERFGLSRVFYAEYFGTLMKVERDYTNGVASIVGEHDLEAFGPELLRAYHDCPVVQVDDVETDRRLGEEARAGLRARQVGAFLDVILFEDERWVSLLALQSAAPRTWTGSEVGLFREVGERIKVAIERAQAEEKLRELNETLEAQVAERTEAFRRYHDIVDATVAPICAFDTEYRLIAFNRAHNDEFRRVNGFDTRIGDVFPDLFLPEQAAKMRALMARALTGESFTVTEAFGRPELGTPCWEISYTPLRNDRGEIIGAFHHAVDLSGKLQMEAELEAAQEALRQSQKMEAMGQLTGGVAHDFNNLLTPIVGSLDMLQRKGLGGEREQRLIAGAMQSAERAKTLVQRLLAFARRQPLQPVPVDVAKLVTGMSELIASTTGPQIRVLVEAPEGLPSANADPNQLEMALLNLAVNARDAMEEGGTLGISTALEDVGAGHRANLQPGRYVRLSVADTGAGMDEATVARAVEPFFSTKGIGKGTGLGLSMVHGLASQLGGGLTIQSRRGHGTTVELWLPTSIAPADLARSADPPSGSRLFQGTALLVDDEEIVRMSTADMLNGLGFTVVEAASAEEAMRLLQEIEDLDLVITDHLMPGLTGTELARTVKSDRPGTPILLVSGYADREGIDPDLPRLTKPFREDELASKLAQLKWSEPVPVDEAGTSVDRA